MVMPGILILHLLAILPWEIHCLFLSEPNSFIYEVEIIYLTYGVTVKFGSDIYKKPTYLSAWHTLSGQQMLAAIDSSSRIL